MSSTVESALAAADASLDASLERLFHLLRIPSISTDPAYAADCRRAAEWLVESLGDAGFEASVRDTPGRPMVVAKDHASDGPHILFYGHYDVQPVDPLSLWDADPFSPQLNDRHGHRVIAGRGSSDDKGQLMTFVEALRAWKHANGDLPIRATILLEGEEESGSPSLNPFLEAAADELRADVAMICDTDMWDRETPAICSMLRGLVGEEVVITGASQDLHSGMFGGPARNPNQVLAEIVASLRNPDGSIAVEGFYDGIAELPEEVAAMWRNLGFDGAKFLSDVDLAVPAGEKDRSILEQIWSRPTCEVNGMWGGYTGEGFKTVLPAKASAKISFRLVAGQDPIRIRDAFRAHVRARLPADMKVEFHEHGASPAVVMPIEGAFLRKALDALTEEWQKQAVVIGSGGSIPVAGSFKRILGMDSLLIGFAHADDRIHSPNEKYDLESFRRGIRSWVRIIDAMSRP